MQQEFIEMTTQDQLDNAVKLLQKLCRMETGLYKRLNEIKKDRVVLEAILNDLSDKHFYRKDENFSLQ